VRFDVEVHEQMKDRDGITSGNTTTSDERLNNRRTTNTHRFRRQQHLSDSSLHASPKKRTEKIRLKDALDVLATYEARCRLRGAGKEIHFIVKNKNRRFDMEISFY
jgi:hypothetical protein